LLYTNCQGGTIATIARHVSFAEITCCTICLTNKSSSQTTSFFHIQCFDVKSKARTKFSIKFDM